jgi:hypothetical protein
MLRRPRLVIALDAVQFLTEPSLAASFTPSIEPHSRPVATMSRHADAKAAAREANIGTVRSNT